MEIIGETSNRDMIKEPHSPPVVSAWQKPRLWTALLSFPIVFLVYTAVQIPIIAIAVIVSMVNSEAAPSGSTPIDESLPAVLTDPLVMLPMLLTGQLSLVAMALGAAFLSPVSVKQRLKLNPTGLPIWALACTALGTLFVASCSVILLSLVASEPSEHLSALSGSMRNLPIPLFMATVLVIGILPGLGEEFIFRGYIQSRLLQRWPPIFAILCASLFFALIHMDPQHMLVALLLGIWCGVAAWRTGSLWTAVACHATNNTFAVVMEQFSDEDAATFDLSTASWGLIALSLPCFLVACVVLFRRQVPQHTVQGQLSHQVDIVDTQ